MSKPKKPAKQHGSTTNHVTITGGKFKGRRIKLPPGNRFHPMGERQRLALMNSIADELKDAYVMDAFAGSGALGVEAISRGAQFVVFSEKDPVVMQYLQDMATGFNLPCSAVWPEAVGNGTLNPDSFEIIFVDPPYDEFNVPSELFPLLRDDGLLVVSHPEGADLSNIPFKKLSSKSYAGANITIFRK